jgi:hypothetical protein
MYAAKSRDGVEVVVVVYLWNEEWVSLNVNLDVASKQIALTDWVCHN